MDGGRGCQGSLPTSMCSARAIPSRPTLASVECGELGVDGILMLELAGGWCCSGGTVRIEPLGIDPTDSTPSLTALACVISVKSCVVVGL